MKTMHTEKMRNADKAYANAREDAKHLPLAEKVLAYRKAMLERNKAYKKAGCHAE